MSSKTIKKRSPDFGGDGEYEFEIVGRPDGELIAIGSITVGNGQAISRVGFARSQPSDEDLKIVERTMRDALIAITGKRARCAYVNADQALHQRAAKIFTPGSAN